MSFFFFFAASLAPASSGVSTVKDQKDIQRDGSSWGGNGM